ncbi:hypothetical protein [Pseudomonas asiatica]|uniref:TubC N-terminal docking domain-containing protein n=1 Tax=Pseudomonas asiatica TaxID=2219225 RepID=A0A9X4CZC7_9PSED|nr:hypothetical protein [Pseudomonas asiatica]MDD2106814.1 hypothetical protein [Pseudomonas asiatica]
MSTVELLHKAKAEGVALVLTGERLTWHADHQPDVELLEQIKTQRLEVIEALRSAKQASSWLHLLVMASGNVIQHCGFASKAEVEQDAHRRHSAELLAVVAVPGVEHALRESEVAKALAGALERHPQSAHVMDADEWLRRVARELKCSPAYLLHHGFIDQHDLKEQRHQPPRAVAFLIRSNPAWTALSLSPLTSLREWN